jgi:hypothetical protein
MVSSGAAAMPRAKLSGKPWAVAFTDSTVEAGLNFTYTYGDPSRKKYVVEANGSGTAFFDYDGDGLLDLFLINGTRLAAPAAGSQPINRLYRNVGKGKFADVTQQAGMARSGWGNGVCAGDIDNDGHLDLYVTYYGRNSLYRNDGKGAFVDMGEASRTAGDGKDWSTGCSFIDYDREMALVVERKHPQTSTREIIAVGRLSKSHGRNEAEFAIAPCAPQVVPPDCARTPEAPHVQPVDRELHRPHRPRVCTVGRWRAPRKMSHPHEMMNLDFPGRWLGLEQLGVVRTSWRSWDCGRSTSGR